MSRYKEEFNIKEMLNERRVRIGLKELVNEEVDAHFAEFDNANDVQNKIHPEIDFAYSSINLMIGRRGSGKTYNVFKQLVALSKIPNDFHLFVYITNNPNDKTYIKFKDLLEIPTVIVNYNDSEEYLLKLRKYKQAYDEMILNGIKPEDLEPDCFEEFKEVLKIEDFEKPRIHTLVLYDDALNVFKRKDKAEYKMIFDNRHTKMTYFFCIQDPLGISTDLKAQLDSCWLFGGFPRNKFTCFTNQIALPLDKEIIWDTYRGIDKHCAILFNFLEDDISYVDDKGRVFSLANEVSGEEVVVVNRYGGMSESGINEEEEDDWT